MITVRNLIQQYRSHHPEGKFFNRDTLELFGESIGRMKVNGKGVILTRDGENKICYELQAEQRIPALGSRIKRYYFDDMDFTPVVPGEDNTTTAWTGGWYEQMRI
jgi:hypothetical protein